MNGRRFCPVCYSQVWPTRGYNIAGHLHKAGRPCDGSGHPYDIALHAPPDEEATA